MFAFLCFKNHILGLCDSLNRPHLLDKERFPRADYSLTQLHKIGD